MLTPSAEIIAHVPSFERIEEKRRDRYQRFPSSVTGNNELWMQRAEWATCCSDLEQLLTKRAHCTLDPPSCWPASFLWSSNKLDRFLDHSSKIYKSQSGESPDGILNSWCGLHLRVLTFWFCICDSLQLLCCFYWSLAKVMSPSRWNSPGQAWKGLSNSQAIKCFCFVLFFLHISVRTQNWPFRRLTLLKIVQAKSPFDT